MAQNLKHHFADGLRWGGEGGDGVREDLGEQGLEVGVVGKGEASEHPI